MKTLSILVPSVHTRRDSFAPRIAAQLFGQWERLPGRERVEILMLTDTKSMVLGDKRTAMVEMASGDYVAFVDDDDRVTDDYLASLLEAIETHQPDVVTFLVSVSLDGKKPRLCRYSIAYAADHNLPREYRRLPNHLMAVRREHALATGFAHLGKGEDSDYAARLKPLLRTEHAIERVLYHYDYSTSTTETQASAPVVDLVMLSKADTPEIVAMTQHAIDSALTGAGAPVNVIVVEQVRGVGYRGATTIHDPSPFAYNAFANAAAKTGAAPWIVVANNDLDFEPGWLAPLLAAGHPVVSPIDPTNPRQRNLATNTFGTVNGKHFSGWCFMIRRELWEQIGGFDEDFLFWCADDSVIEQLRAVGVTPMLVPAAKVRHLVSRTLDPRSDDGHLTWSQVHLFEQKYGVRKFETDRRYMQWKRQNRIAG